ncbi:MAG: hypothetical protein IPK25_14845 [Saprospiraceae bacterium]|nr:hypothetical protein [Saprospiraceae bacterium]
MTNYFNFLNFYVWVFIALTLPNLLSSQTGPNVPQTERVLCYSTTTKEVQKLSSTVNYSEIQTHELLRTKVITYKKAFQVSLDDSDNYITKYRYLYHKNLFRIGTLPLMKLSSTMLVPDRFFDYLNYL